LALAMTSVFSKIIPVNRIPSSLYPRCRSVV